MLLRTNTTRLASSLLQLHYALSHVTSDRVTLPITHLIGVTIHFTSLLQFLPGMITLGHG